MIKTIRPGIIVVDDFLEDPMGWRNLALSQQYSKDPDHYDGYRNDEHYDLPEFRAAFEDLLLRDICNWREGMSATGLFQYTVSNSDCLHHTDEQDYAAAIYLSPNAPYEAGTSFWRNRRSGFRHEPTREDAADKGVSLQTLMDQTYHNALEDRTKWELIDQVGNIFNRLVLWPGNLCHSASGYFGHNLETGRLVQLFFFDVL